MLQITLSSQQQYFSSRMISINIWIHALYPEKPQIFQLRLSKTFLGNSCIRHTSCLPKVCSQQSKKHLAAGWKEGRRDEQISRAGCSCFTLSWQNDVKEMLECRALLLFFICLSHSITILAAASFHCLEQSYWSFMSLLHMSKLCHGHFIAIGPPEEHHAELMSFLLHRRAMFP